MGAHGPAATITPPVASGIYSYNSATTHATRQVPDAWKERYVTIYPQLQTVFILFGTASSLEVDRTAAPSNGTGATYGKPMVIESSKYDGYTMYVREVDTWFAVESSATASIRVELTSYQAGPVGSKSGSP